MAGVSACKSEERSPPAMNCLTMVRGVISTGASKADRTDAVAALERLLSSRMEVHGVAIAVLAACDLVVATGDAGGAGVNAVLAPQCC